jgi:hypothetical protein
MLPPVRAGALVHFNCHNQELVPFGPAGVRTFIEALLIAGASAEDALAASFCLCRFVGFRGLGQPEPHGMQITAGASAEDALAASFCPCRWAYCITLQQRLTLQRLLCLCWRS